ncbi:regulation of enolase 1 [Labrys miyagiensis]
MPTYVELPSLRLGRWLNEPATWSLEKGVLDVVTNEATDFWRQTHYGFTRDSGHFFFLDSAGAFTAEVRVRARFETLYDQAGLMVRLGEEAWLKAGIEYNDGAPMIGSVLTTGRSDWATGPFIGDPADFRMRITVSHGVLRLQYSADGKHWPLMRLAPFPEAASYQVGPMCCTPERAGLHVSFSDFLLTPPGGKALHDLS